MKSIPNDCHDPELERLLDEYRVSQERAVEQQLAATGECPAPAELADLANGRIHVAQRRELLARHLVHCSRCLDQNLDQLLVRDAGHAVAPAASPVRAARSLRRHFAAAAAVVLCALWGGLSTPTPRSPALAGVFLTDPLGLEPRGQLFLAGGSYRLLAVPRAAGHLALVRVDDGGARWVEVEPANHFVPVAADTEVLLPLDHAIAPGGAVAWIVVLAEHRPDAAQMADWLPRLAVGEQPAGTATERVTVLPQSHASGSRH